MLGNPIICLPGGLIRYIAVLPATGCGFLATAVLNINNIRDMDTDITTGKADICSGLAVLGPPLPLVSGARQGLMAMVYIVLRAQTTAWLAPPVFDTGPLVSPPV